MKETIFQQFSTGDKISLLIRHSNRHEITSGTDGYNVLLSDVGIENAIKLGEQLSHYKLNKIITTPVQRCIQTAEFIVNGYGQQIEIEPSNAFGGLHITDWQLANDYFNTHGYEEWYRNIIADKNIQGICDAEAYRKLMTDFITENTTESGLTIFISHDFLIAFYHYALNKTIYTMFSDWVNFLSGLIFKEGQYVARFQNN